VLIVATGEESGLRRTGMSQGRSEANDVSDVGLNSRRSCRVQDLMEQ
jgi:hypothetical protein